MIVGRAAVRVHTAGKVVMFGSTAWPIPVDFVTRPTLDLATAIARQARGEEPVPLPVGAPASF